MRRAILLVLAVAVLAASQGAKTLDVYFVDVEGGQATLFVAPSGESLLVDAGWPGFEGRDADRIAAVVKRAGLSRIDYLVVTHYHADHVGGVPALAAKIPIVTFIDHGPTVEDGEQAAELYRRYVETRAKGRHLLVKPGDKIPLAGVDITVVAVNEERIADAVPGGGQPNGLCSSFTPKAPDPSENARSVGFVLTYGRFRLLDIGDRTWNKERDLVCPDNVLGPIDVYVVTHHGADSSGAPVLVHAIRPRVAVMNNGATKGGSPEAWRTVRSAPGLEDLWQLHYAVNGGPEHNSPAALIANLDETTGFGIKLSVNADASFVVSNDRTGESRRYKPLP